MNSDFPALAHDSLVLVVIPKNVNESTLVEDIDWRAYADQEWHLGKTKSSATRALAVVYESRIRAVWRVVDFNLYTIENYDTLYKLNWTRFDLQPDESLDHIVGRLTPADWDEKDAITLTAAHIGLGDVNKAE
ncbi:hypothetical protein [Subtercola endophyticus]|uniref:hypothetical protein n=1 Tax=Subtercola endophyticus TaxID=2895559 RepID=UPI001E5434B5|nr:hypothetical protein [Subtercola endophyticus]UFS57645.1 hypothetical protein LQ955_11295 [Subtercola endophyticus]